MSAYKYDFKQLKAKVGIDDIALSLGYKVNRRAGLGRYVELVLSDGTGDVKDSIVVSHPNDKQYQTYFRRSNGQNKDVLQFIIENKDSFNVQGRSDWEIAGEVMSKFANEPVRESPEREYMRNSVARGPFDPKAYETIPIAEGIGNVRHLFNQRKISNETIKAFAPWLAAIRKAESDNMYYNIGFPYRHPGSEAIEGFELRGYGGFKGKATGTNSSTAAWICDFSDGSNPYEIDNIFFAESAFDVMAFYQQNRAKLQSSGQLNRSAFVSIGGTFSRGQITSLMDYYKNARAVDCFDNDLAGRVYGIRMVDVSEKLGLVIGQAGDKLKIRYDGKDHLLDAATANLNDLRSFVKFKRQYGLWKAPSNFKDWNDVIMNKPFLQEATPSKYEMVENLEKRRVGMKI